MSGRPPRGQNKPPKVPSTPGTAGADVSEPLSAGSKRAQLASDSGGKKSRSETDSSSSSQAPLENPSSGNLDPPTSAGTNENDQTSSSSSSDSTNNVLDAVSARMILGVRTDPSGPVRDTIYSDEIPTQNSQETGSSSSSSSSSQGVALPPLPPPPPIPSFPPIDLTSSPAYIALQAHIAQLQAELALLRQQAAPPVQANMSGFNLSVQATSELTRLTDLKPSSVRRFVAQFKPGMLVTPRELMTDIVRVQLSDHVAAMYSNLDVLPDWTQWSTPDFTTWALQAFPVQAYKASQALTERVKEWAVDLDLEDSSVLDRCLAQLIEIEQSSTADELRDDQANAVVQIVKNQLKHSNNSCLSCAAQELGAVNPAQTPKTFSALRIDLLRLQREFRDLSARTSRFAQVNLKPIQFPLKKNVGGKNSREGGQQFSKQGQQQQQQQQSRSHGDKSSSSGAHSTPCNVCGRTGHERKDCKFMNPDGKTSWHPNANLTTQPWLTSPNGISMKSKRNAAVLPTFIDENNAPVTVPAWTNFKMPSQQNKGQSSKSLVTASASCLQSINTNDYIHCKLTLPNQTNPVAEADCLLDNGTLGAANFMSKDIAAEVIRAGAIKSVVKQTVASAFNNISCIAEFNLFYDVILITETSKDQLRLPIEAFIIDTPIDVILGRETIKKYNLVTLFPSQFFVELAESTGGARGVRLMDASESALVNECEPRIVTAMHLRNLTDFITPDGHPSDSEWHASAFEAFETVINSNYIVRRHHLSNDYRSRR